MEDELLKKASTPVETFNKFMVAAGKLPSGEPAMAFLRPIPQTVNYQDALLLAAYLVAMVGDDEQWQKTLTAVQGI